MGENGVKEFIAPGWEPVKVAVVNGVIIHNQNGRTTQLAIECWNDYVEFIESRLQKKTHRLEDATP